MRMSLWLYKRTCKLRTSAVLGQVIIVLYDNAEITRMRSANVFSAIRALELHLARTLLTELTVICNLENSG